MSNYADHWSTNFKHPQVRRLSVVPFILQASDLIDRAAMLYQSHFGAGRQGSAQLRDKAKQLRTICYNMQHMGWGWCSSEDEADCGRLLVDYRDLAYLPQPTPMPAIKSIKIARQLVWCAVELLNQHLKTLQLESMYDDPRSWSGNKVLTNNIEDILEELGNIPSIDSPLVVVPGRAINYLEGQSALFAAASITHSVYYMLFCGKTIKDRLETVYPQWGVASNQLLTLSHQMYEKFIRELGYAPDQTLYQVLMSIAHIRHFSVNYEDHYENLEGVKSCIKLVRKIILAFLHSANSLIELPTALPADDSFEPITGIQLIERSDYAPPPEWLLNLIAKEQAATETSA